MKKTAYLSVFIAGIILSLAILFSAKKARELTIMEATPSTATVQRKVMVLNFNPIIESQGSRRLTEILGWNNPLPVSEQYILDVFETSHNYLGYQIADWQDIDDFPQLNDGFDYDDQTWFDCWNNNTLCHNPTQVNYNKILDDYQVCDKVNAGLVDELWLWGGPWFGYWEANMAGSGAFYTNGPVINGSTCNRPIHIMGYSYERGNSEMAENLMHRIEGTMEYTFGEDPRDFPYPHNTPWGKFALWDKAVPGQAACGWTHYAPNSISDYDWGNQNTVTSTCDDWLNYPNLTASGSAINCTAWNCNGYEYKKWWLWHLPHAIGTTNNKLNNWWKYIIDFANANSLPDPPPPPSPSPSAPPSPSPYSCEINTGAAWCPNHGGIALTVDHDVNNWSECISWCRQNMTSALPICQYNGDGPRSCWVNFASAGGISACYWEAGTPLPMGACYNSIMPSPSLSPSPSPSPSLSPSPSPVNSPPNIITTKLPAAKNKTSYFTLIEGYDLNYSDTLIFSVSGLPTGLKITNCHQFAAPGRGPSTMINCSVTGKPNVTITLPKTYNIKITLNDNRGGLRQKTFQLRLNQ